MLFRKGWEFSYPILPLNGNSTLQLSFDYLGNERMEFYYSFVHCNSDWSPSEYQNFDGNSVNEIEKFRFSFNTLCAYVHYDLTFPNENIKFLQSGNYIIKVSFDRKGEDIAFIWRFCVLESKVSVKANVKRPDLDEFRNSGQEVDFQILHPNFQFINPYQSVKVVISQNGRWDNVISHLKPLFVKPDELVYDYQNENIFLGGSEFRYFSTQNMHFASENVQKIAVKDVYYVDLQRERNTKFKAYFFNEDFNGKIFVKLQGSTDSDVDADYVKVNFCVPCQNEIPNGNVYLLYNLPNESFSETNKMTYNFENQEYTLTLSLKQGYYNYDFIFRDSKKKEIFYPFTESHFQTENDYIIFVYYADLSAGYDRLVGVGIFNTLKRY